MTTYWLLGDKRLDENNRQNGDGDGAGPSTSFAGNYNNVNPSITFQGPDSPGGHSLAQNGHTYNLNNPEDDDDLQSQGACALPSNHRLGKNTTNEVNYTQEVEMYEMCYQENPVYPTTTKLSVELQNERTRIAREMNTGISMDLVNSSNDVVEDKSKKEDRQTSSSRNMSLERSYERGHDGERQSNGVISRGKVRATVLMFNQRWLNDDNSKKPK